MRVSRIAAPASARRDASDGLAGPSPGVSRVSSSLTRSPHRRRWGPEPSAILAARRGCQCVLPAPRCPALVLADSSVLLQKLTGGVLAAGPLALDLCDCQKSTGSPDGLGCDREGYFVSSFEQRGSWVRRRACSCCCRCRRTAPLTAFVLSRPRAPRRKEPQRWCRSRTRCAAGLASPQRFPMPQARGAGSTAAAASDPTEQG